VGGGVGLEGIQFVTLHLVTPRPSEGGDGAMVVRVGPFFGAHHHRARWGHEKQGPPAHNRFTSDHDLDPLVGPRRVTRRCADSSPLSSCFLGRCGGCFGPFLLNKKNETRED
jgi:hypothetical protein